MIRYSTALARLLEAASKRSLPVEEVLLSRADGRVAAGAVRAPGQLPRFDNSAMDGYAVLAARTAGASGSRPLSLRVAGMIAAGDRPPRRAGPSCAWEIMTGAPIPPGCDAVVPVELVERRGGDVVLRRPARAGDHVRWRGTDLRAGSLILEAGAAIGPAQILTLAAAGIGRVRVLRRPRVTVLATGRELAAPGSRARPGQVHDASSAFLEAALMRLGAEPDMRGRVTDDPAAFAKALGPALKAEPDLVLTTGAVSKGRFDFVTAALADAGCRTLFHGVAQRPGRPALGAVFPRGPIVLGLPGNPVSTAVGLRFFAVPILRSWLGLPRERPLAAVLEREQEKHEGLRYFLKAVVSAGPRGLSARLLRGQASFQVAPLLRANAWAVLPEAGRVARAGARIDVFPLLPADPPFPA